jgi:hypothetical protein
MPEFIAAQEERQEGALHVVEIDCGGYRCSVQKQPCEKRRLHREPAMGW